MPREDDTTLTRRQRRHPQPVQVPAAHGDDTKRLSLTLTQTQWAGTFPHPDDMERYERLYTGAAGTIFEDFREQSAHRMRQEALVVQANVRAQERAPIIAAVISLATITSGTLIALHGEIWPGIIEGLSPTAIIVASRIFSQRKQGADLRAKRDDLQRRIGNKGK